MNPEKLAQENKSIRLGQNPYPGRGIVLGLNRSSSHFVQIYWIMGRSANSRNRIFKLENNCLQTQPLDRTKVENPELIIYNALHEIDSNFIVSNGVQTDTIVTHLAEGQSFESAVNRHMYEPDAPNFTPRIAGSISFKNAQSTFKLAIAKKSIFDDSVNRHFFTYEQLMPGFGFCIHTYQSDGNPLPPFLGEPYPVPIAESKEEIADAYWQTLDEANKISLVVKTIAIKSRQTDYQIINKYSLS